MQSTSCVSPNYMAQQFDINERMRAILIDWLIEVYWMFPTEPLCQKILIVGAWIDFVFNQSQCPNTDMLDLDLSGARQIRPDAWDIVPYC